MSFFKRLFGSSKEKKSTKNNNHQFSTWKVKNLIKETEDAVSIIFEKPQDFNFKAGQFITLKTKIQGKEVRRSYSFSSSPNETDLAVTVKKIVNGYFSAYVNDSLKIGEEIQVMGADGNFWVLNETNKKYVAFVGGSGITPIMSIIKTILTLNNSNSFHLFYGNRDFKSIIFRQQLVDLTQQYPGKLNTTHILEEKEGEGEFFGRMDDAMIETFSKKYFNVQEVDYFLICGPGNMIDNISNKLQAIGTQKDKIKFELFTPIIQKDIIVKDIISPATINYTFNNNQNSIEYNNPNKTILDSIIESGIEVPYSCKTGNCGTCCAKLNSGKIYSSTSALGLTEEQIAQGYVLPCVSYPSEREINLDFDDYSS